MEDRPVEINDLNKTQLILLAILLSFVVSVATGIVTVTLLQQAPPAVTQTINRVVQQTIEKAVPDYIPGKTQTVIVKEDELVVDAVTKTRANLFPIFEGIESKNSFADAYSVGGGMFITKYDGLGQTNNYIIKNGSDIIFVKIVGVSDDGLALLASDKDDKSISKFPTSIFGQDSDVKAGQTVIAVSGKLIYKDTVQNILYKKQKDTGPQVVNSDIWNVFTVGGDISNNLNGFPVANLDGNVIGFASSMSISDGLTKPQIIGVDAVVKMISEFQKVRATGATLLPKAPASQLPASVEGAVLP